MSKTIVQTRLICGAGIEEIQDQINNFLIDNNIGSSELIDIKMTECISSWSALIIYKTSSY